MSVEIKYYVDAMVLNEAPRMIFRRMVQEGQVNYEYCNEFTSWTQNDNLASKIWGYQSGELADELPTKKALEIINKWSDNWDG